MYEDDLIVFPSAYEDRKDMGVSLIHVDGVYKSGVNGPEARVIIDAALDFMERSPDRSLGIVTLNQKQRDLLIEEMEYALRNRRMARNYIDRWNEKQDGLQSFFIKNLENVQGDERDAIFIGTVYGSEKSGGPVLQRFGPINGLAGKRRLNVLFSRAKEQIVTFSSMTAADIRADENGNPGTYMLKRWLEYSATGVLEAGTLTEREPDSDFEVFVIDQIKAMGCEPVPQVGVAGYFIDIGVKHPNWPHGFVLGVECDGAAYHSSKSARDRDRLRQQVLENLGWHLHRIWSTDWFNDPREQAVRLRKAIEARLADLKRMGEEKFVLVNAEKNALIQKTNSVDIDTDEHETTVEPGEHFINGDTGIDIGDKVRVKFLTGDLRTLEVTLTKDRNDPEFGLLHVSEPMGLALIGAEEGDEIQFLVGSHIRSALIERVEKASNELSGVMEPAHSYANRDLVKEKPLTEDGSVLTKIEEEAPEKDPSSIVGMPSQRPIHVAQESRETIAADVDTDAETKPPLPQEMLADIPAFSDFVAALPLDSGGEPDVAGYGLKIMRAVSGLQVVTWTALSNDEKAEALRIASEA